MKIKLPLLDDWNNQRIDIASNYFNSLKGFCDLPIVHNNQKHVYHLFVIKHPERDKLAEHLKNKGISVGLHYPIPIHLQPPFSYLGYKKGDFPLSEKYAKEILSLPIFPGMTSQEVNYVTDSIKSF